MSVSSVEPGTTSPGSPSAPSPAQRQRRLPPVAFWAVAGAAIFAFQLYIWTKWITGPNFVAVPVGPDQPPEWIKATVTTWQIIGWPLAGACVYWFMVRPWRRERRISTDVLLIPVWLLLYFQDPLSSYLGNWFTYNAYAFNRGSWIAEMPGWMSFAKPGRMLLEPFVWAVPAYIYGLFLGTVIGCWAMRKVQQRWPGTHPVALAALSWPIMAILDFVLEGVIWMPQGLYTYGGGHIQLLGNQYFKFPLSEALLWGFAWAALTCVRFFKDDRGRTAFEKGIDQLRLGGKRKMAVRFLAVLGACQIVYFMTFTVPTSILVGANSAEWPQSTQNTSYMNDHICGHGTDRACPGPGVPNDKPGAPYLGTDGTFHPAGSGS
jgi:hypothetical protein